MPAIDALRIRRILDSRGNAAGGVGVRAGGAVGRAAAPAGASTGTHEVAAWPMGGLEEGILRFREEIAAKLAGMDCAAQAEVDGILHAIDGTPNFARIGGDGAVATSRAVAKAAAAAAGKPLHAYLGDGRIPPYPLGNVIGGGRHAIGGTDIQEYLSLAQSHAPSKAVFANARVHRLVAAELARRLPGG